MKNLTALENQTDTALNEDALLHWETLFVVASGDNELVAFPLVAKDFTVDNGAHSLFIELTPVSVFKTTLLTPSCRLRFQCI